MVNLLLIYVINIFKNNENLHIIVKQRGAFNVSHSNAQQLGLGVTPHQRILNPDLLKIDTFIRNLFFF